MARRARKAKRGKWLGRLLVAILALPALYLAAALIGSLVPVNRSWQEPANGTTIYLADNGVHVDLIMPIAAQGLDWRPLIPARDFANADPGSGFIAFGSGERRVYLNTPTWWDLTPRTLSSALTGGDRVMHVEYVPSPYYAVRQIRLRPEEYRRLWAAIRADFVLDARGRPAADRPSRIWSVGRVLPGDRQSQRGQDLQQLGGEPAAPRRGEDQPVAALRPRVGVALSL